MSFLEKAIMIRNADVDSPSADARDANQRVLVSGYDRPYQERTPIENLLYYIGILWRYKWLIIGVTGLAGFAVVAFAYISITLPPEESPMPNYYTSEAVLVFQQEGGQSSVAALMESLGMPVSPTIGSMDYGQLAIKVMRSRAQIDRIIEVLGIRDRFTAEDTEVVIPQHKLREIVLASAGFGLDSRTGTLNITYDSTDPVFARDVVQTMIVQLDQWFQNEIVSEQATQKELLERKLEEVSGRIANLEGQIREIQERHKVLTIEDLANYQGDFLADLRTQKANKELEIKNYSRFARINDTKLEKLQVELANLNDLIRQVENGEYNSLPAQDELPELASRFSELSNELELQQRIYNTLSEQYEVVKLSEETKPFFRVLEPPEVPAEKSGPDRKELVVMATGGAFFVSVVLSFLLHVGRAWVRDPEKVKLLSGRKA